MNMQDKKNLVLKNKEKLQKLMNHQHIGRAAGVFFRGSFLQIITIMSFVIEIL